MRFARFECHGAVKYGLVEDERITAIEGSPFESWRTTGPARELRDVALHVPVVPPNFYAVGLNYAEHVRERARRQGIQAELPQRAEPGYRSPSALLPHGAAIVLPNDTKSVQFEGEL